MIGSAETISSIQAIRRGAKKGGYPSMVLGSSSSQKVRDESSTVCAARDGAAKSTTTMAGTANRIKSTSPIS